MANGYAEDWTRNMVPLTDNVDDINPRTLYVGNLDPSVSEEFITSLFGQIGNVSKCKIIHETATDPYAFVEFHDNASAVQALTAMNRRLLLGKELKVNWATHPGHTQRVDTSHHFHVFVGDLSHEIDNKTLKDAFAPFGEISDAKVIRDLQTLKSKGYGFVSFVNKEDAEKAIEQMNGQWLGRKTIRTNWATRKPPSSGWSNTSSSGGGGAGGGGGGYSGRRAHAMTYEDVWQQTGPTNFTVYVGNMAPELGEEDIREHFAPYGHILEVRIFRQQGYCFVRYDNKESACNAILNLNNGEIKGCHLRCSWGREDYQRTGGAAGAPPNPHAGGGGHHPGGGMPGGFPSVQQQMQQHYGPAAGGYGVPAGPHSVEAHYQYWAQYYAQYYGGDPDMYIKQWQQQGLSIGQPGGPPPPSQ